MIPWRVTIDGKKLYVYAPTEARAAWVAFGALVMNGGAVGRRPSVTIEPLTNPG